MYEKIWIKNINAILELFKKDNKFILNMRSECYDDIDSDTDTDSNSDIDTSVDIGSL